MGVMNAPAGFAYVAEPALAMQRNPVSPFYEKKKVLCEPTLAVQRNAVLYHILSPFYEKERWA